MFVCAGSCALVAAALVSAGVASSVPPADGLCVWLDASDTRLLVLNGSGRLKRWRDKSPEQNDAVAPEPDSGPLLVRQAMNGLPVVRFDGGCWLEVPCIRKVPGSVTVFVVSQRSAAQASEKKWQRLVSSWDGSENPDNRPPNFCVTADRAGQGGAYGPAIYVASYSAAVLGPLAIGRSRRWKGEFLRGDIAELLIYDRGFLSEESLDQVLGYLAAKWGAHVAREDVGWTRVGPLGPAPKRLTDSLPLSDQQNKGDWVPFEPLSDEFEGDRLDEDKWMPRHPHWLGRQPAYFWTDNVSLNDGELCLTMRKEEAPDQPHERGYHDYTSACVQGRTPVLYGYFEVRAKPMRSAGSSAFWFANNQKDWWTEIDVFEIGGGAPGFERKYNMNLHVHHTPTSAEHWSRGGAWTAPWNLADDYHVYGLDWEKDKIRYYVDGVLVRSVDNTHWHQPLYLIFDSETMPNWFGMPRDGDLPSTFRIDYVRAWKRGAS